jgi:hypothetical protein
MGCTVEELLGKISSRELTEWIAYYKLKSDEQEKENKEMEKKIPKGKRR